MKIVALAIGLGMIQVLMNGVIDVIPPPKDGHKVLTEITAESTERWECVRCGNDNGEWTSICGKCGRTKGR